MRKYMKIGIGLAVAAVLGGSAYYYKSTQNTIADTDATEEVEKMQPVGPSFNADSAYSYTKTIHPKPPLLNHTTIKKTKITN